MKPDLLPDGPVHGLNGWWTGKPVERARNAA
jgi:hypothetical protein